MVGKYSHASYGCAALSSIANSKSLTEVAGLVLGEVANMIASIGHLFFLLLFNSSIFVAQAVVDTQSSRIYHMNGQFFSMTSAACVGNYYLILIDCSR